MGWVAMMRARWSAPICGALLLASCGEVSPEPDDAQAERAVLERGERLYVEHCQACHGDRGGQGRAMGAPPHNEAGHTWHHPDVQLLEWVLEGRHGTAMPAFGDVLSEADARAILTFIKTWWSEEQRETQADISERYGEALER